MVVVTTRFVIRTKAADAAATYLTHATDHGVERNEHHNELFFMLWLLLSR